VAGVSTASHRMAWIAIRAQNRYCRTN